MVEISRRCRGCGASVRARARFCPQCGREVADQQATARPATTARAPEETKIVEAAASPIRQESETLGPPPQEVVVPEPAQAEGRKPAGIIVSGVARETMEQQVAPRFEKIRQASNVMLDEAADDPGVRFLLIAAFIFLLFIVIFAITTIIK